MNDTKKALLAEVLSLQSQIEENKKTVQMINEAIAANEPQGNKNDLQA